MVYKQIKINITRPQLQKALNGKPVQFSASQIGSGGSYLSLHPVNVQKIEKAAMKGSGCVIHLAPGELMATAEDMNGEGIFGDIWKGLKSGYKFVKKNIIDTDIYQKALKPLVKQAVDTGATMAKTYVPNAGPLIDIATDQIGKRTGAFGISKAKKMALLKGKGLYIS